MNYAIVRSIPNGLHIRFCKGRLFAQVVDGERLIAIPSKYTTAEDITNFCKKVMNYVEKTVNRPSWTESHTVYPARVRQYGLRFYQGNIGSHRARNVEPGSI